MAPAQARRRPLPCLLLGQLHNALCLQRMHVIRPPNDVQIQWLGARCAAEGEEKPTPAEVLRDAVRDAKVKVLKVTHASVTHESPAPPWFTRRRDLRLCISHE